MANIIECGKGMKVKLVGVMPRESYTDIAGQFTRTEKGLDDILAMPYNEKLVTKIVNMGHLAATEFDYFIFAVEGLSRVTEVQLVRKRLASYLIKSGRPNKSGKRSYDVIKPKSLDGFYASIKINPARVLINDSENLERITGFGSSAVIDVTFEDLIDMLEQFYEQGVKQGLPEEDLRYTKPQGTEFKGLIGMNAHALLDWFKIRCCLNAQHEIRGLANSMLRLAKEHSPALFKNAGASCKVLGYCPENEFQHEKCKGKVLTHTEVLELIKEHKRK